jgi:hypothetical protein
MTKQKWGHWVSVYVCVCGLSEEWFVLLWFNINTTNEGNNELVGKIYKNIYSQLCIIKGTQGYMEIYHYEQLTLILRFKLCALFINGKNETDLYRQWFVI